MGRGGVYGTDVSGRASRDHAATNVFTMGKTAFSLFTDSDFSEEKWPLTQASYAVLCKATAPARAMRYQNIAQLRAAWHDAL